MKKGKHPHNRGGEIRNQFMNASSTADLSTKATNVKGDVSPAQLNHFTGLLLSTVLKRFSDQIPDLRKNFPLEKPYRESSHMALTQEEEALKEDERIKAEIDMNIAANNAARPKAILRELRTWFNKLTLTVQASLIILFPPVSVITVQSFVQQNSSSGSEWAAWGLAISIWILSVGLKCAVEGPLKLFKWPLEILLTLVLITSGGLAIFEICSHYMIHIETALETTPVDLFSTETTEPKIEDLSRLFYALILSETAGLYLLCSAFSRSILPERHEKHTKIDNENQVLERRRWIIQRRIPRRRARIAALSARKTRSETFAEIFKTLSHQFSK